MAHKASGIAVQLLVYSVKCRRLITEREFVYVVRDRSSVEISFSPQPFFAELKIEDGGDTFHEEY